MTLKSSNTWIKASIAGAVLLTLGACAAVEGIVNNPIERKFSWFSFLEGGDFKQSCDARSAGHYRMVYNAVYEEQVRIYELDAASETLDVRVILPANLSNLDVRQASDLLNPWRGTVASTRLSSADVNGFINDLGSFGVFGEPNVGAELSSKGFFWTIAACHEGQYHFTGFQWPDQSWDQATFADRLFALDETGIAVNAPRWTSVKRTFTYQRDKTGQTINEYHTKVGPDGLVRLSDLF